MAFGTNGDDTLTGGDGGDNIFGRSGNDFIRGRGGDDNLQGSNGNDEIRGGAGNDRIDGGNDDDTLLGGGGEDRIDGGRGEDVIEGGGGGDFIDAGEGNDVISGGGGADDIRAGEGDDVIDAGGGADTILGGDGADTIDAGKGRDEINGGEGQDFITTGAGRDTITFDVNILGRGDVDRSSRQVTGGEDFITDFTRGKDTINLDGEAFRIFGELNFVNALAEALAAAGANVIVLQNSDDDNDPTTPFNAGSAANLIAEQVTEAGPGFFVYFNSGLGVNRLVYSEDLSDPTADLQIVARFTNEEGDDAIAALADFTAGDFAFVNEQRAGDAPVEVELQPGGETFFVDEFSDAGSVSSDLDVRFNPGRGPVVDFDPTTDVVQIDQALIELDEFLDVRSGPNDTFLDLSGFTTDETAARRIVEADQGQGAAIAVYYDEVDDTVNVALVTELDRPSLSFSADVIIEFDVDGAAEGDALLAALSPANFQIVSPADLDAPASPFAADEGVIQPVIDMDMFI